MSKVVVATNETSSRPEFAGWMWVPLQYVLGLERLGIETFWLDRVGAIDPYRAPHSIEYLMERQRRSAREFGFEGKFAIDYDNGERFFGLSESELDTALQRADLLINLGGHLPPDSALGAIPRRAYLDVDPGYTHIWALEKDIGLERHNFFFTVGQNVGGPEFKIPTGGVDWEPILPPVVLSLWPPRIDEKCRRFTTVADWRGSQDAIFDGEYYGTKRKEFVRFLRVPEQADQRIEMALCIGQHDYEDLGLLTGHNWRVRDPCQYAGDLESYREFVRFSRAEFSVAKSGYVKASSGWVSDRTACYLASGKPALVQSTGFEWRLPTGRGLLTFSTVDEAVDGMRSINSEYLAHCAAARRLAEEHFNSDTILRSMLERVGL